LHSTHGENYDGRCHCGEITFEAEVDPDAPHICRCTDCQTLSGSAFRMNILASGEHFVLRGTPKTYIKTAESGNKRLHAFCGTCGTPIYACGVDNPQIYGLRVGTITRRAAFAPAAADLAAVCTALGGRARHRPGGREGLNSYTSRMGERRWKNLRSELRLLPMSLPSKKL
jgi:hypothetical protein